MEGTAEILFLKADGKWGGEPCFFPPPVFPSNPLALKGLVPLPASRDLRSPLLQVSTGSPMGCVLSPTTMSLHLPPKADKSQLSSTMGAFRELHLLPHS